MCFKRSPKYDWIIIISTDNQTSADDIYNFTKEQLKLIDDHYYGTVKKMSKFCLYVIEHVYGIIKIEAQTMHWHPNTPKIKISIEKLSEDLNKLIKEE